MHGFICDHQRMISLAEAILEAARDTKADAERRLTRARLDLSRAVSDHVRVEVAFLGSSGGAERLDQTTLSRYHDELLAWRQALMDCNAAWPIARIQADRAGFARAFRPLLHALKERVRWEEEQLYPRLRAAA